MNALIVDWLECPTSGPIISKRINHQSRLSPAWVRCSESIIQKEPITKLRCYWLLINGWISFGWPHNESFLFRFFFGLWLRFLFVSRKYITKMTNGNYCFQFITQQKQSENKQYHLSPFFFLEWNQWSLLTFSVLD